MQGQISLHQLCFFIVKRGIFGKSEQYNARTACINDVSSLSREVHVSSVRVSSARPDQSASIMFLHCQERYRR